MWFGLYAVAALVVGAAVFVLAEFQRAPDTAAPRWPGLFAIAAGFLWPLVLIGAAQWGLLLAVSHHLGRRALSVGDRPPLIAQRIG